MSTTPKALVIASAAVVVVAAAASIALNLIAGTEEPAPRIAVQRLDRDWLPAAVAPAVTVRHDVQSSGPPLEGTDVIVRAAVAELSSHPALGDWLIGKGLVRRFVAAVEAVAGGYSPRESLAFLRPRDPFLVRESAGRLVIAPSTYHRWDLLTDVVTSIDTTGAVALYHRLGPALDAAHREMAWFSGDFDDRLHEAIDHLLMVDIPEGDVEVARGVLTYSFSDPGLEGMTDAQRQLLRLGPTNARRIQTKLRELQEALLANPISTNT
jgi:hypothetical protein